MTMRFVPTVVFLLIFSGQAHADGKWRDWSEDLFKEAKKENKLLILDLEAVWCHWCHVMHEKTYSNTEIKKILAEKFIQIRVDQDSRPDLATRYEDYGWPATIFFTADGREIVKRSGFIPPEEMKRLLQKVVKDPTPEAEKNEPRATSAPQGGIRADLEDVVEKNYDEKLGGFDISHKFLDLDFAEYQLRLAMSGDEKAKKRLIQTLDGQLLIQDPIWGGFYQYSARGVWTEPHFEKIMSMQADNVKAYAQAYLFTGDKKYLETAKATARYVQDFLTSPEGAFYTSQDADLVPGQHSEGYFKKNDRDRRKLGIPRVDKNVYSRENGWMIQSLLTLHSASGDETYLKRAVRAAEWAKANRGRSGGGFNHGPDDRGGPYLNDNTQMGLAFLRLYAATGNRAWLEEGRRTFDFIIQTFKQKSSGFVTSAPQPNALFPGSASVLENIPLARFANLLSQYSGRVSEDEVARSQVQFLSKNPKSRELFTASGVLLVIAESAEPPVHLTLVGKKDDLAAIELWKETRKFPLSYQRTEWWDRREGAMPKDDVKYPDMNRPAVFVCSANRCSLPALDAATVQKQIQTLRAKTENQKKGSGK